MTALGGPQELIVLKTILPQVIKPSPSKKKKVALYALWEKDTFTTLIWNLKKDWLYKRFGWNWIDQNGNSRLF